MLLKEAWGFGMGGTFWHPCRSKVHCVGGTLYHLVGQEVRVREEGLGQVLRLAILLCGSSPISCCWVAAQ